MSSQEDINNCDSTPDSSLRSVNDNAALLEPKPQPKIIRVLTVLAYILSVSMAAILLSIYYIFMWDGKPHLGARISHEGIYNDAVTLTTPMDSQMPKYAKLEMNLEEYIVNNDSMDAKMIKNENVTFLNHTTFNAEMQQQVTPMESEEVTFPAIAATGSAVSTTTEENTTFLDYENVGAEIDDLNKSTLIKKLMFYKKYQYAEYD